LLQDVKGLTKLDSVSAWVCWQFCKTKLVAVRNDGSSVVGS